MTRRENKTLVERVKTGLDLVAAISATTRLPLLTADLAGIVDKFEVSAPAGYTADASNYYDISLQSVLQTFTASGNTLTVAAAYRTGDAVQVTNSGGALPSGLTAGVTYYAIKLTATTLQLATTPSNAAAGTAITLSDAGTGTQSVAKVLAMYSLKTTTGNGSLVANTLASGTLQPYTDYGANRQIDIVLTKFGSAANLAAATRIVAHLRLT